MVKRSLLFRERLNTPLETAMYWVDHVLKHKGTSHLRPASTQLTAFEFYSIDVFIILALIFWITMKIVQFLIRQIFQKLKSVKNTLSPNVGFLQEGNVTKHLKSN